MQENQRENGDQAGNPLLTSSTISQPDLVVEQQILSRVAVVCNLPSSNLPEKPLVSDQAAMAQHYARLSAEVLLKIWHSQQ